MATAKTRAGRGGAPRRRLGWGSAVLFALLAAALGYWAFGSGVGGYAAAGTAYGAKTACSCRYIAGRELASCERDFVPGMELVFLREDEEARSVTAFVPLLKSTTAHYRDGFGCVLEAAEG